MTSALGTESADAAKSVVIIVSDRAASGGIDRFGGGTRPTALSYRWERRGLLAMGDGEFQQSARRMVR